ncbi:calcium-binding protein, partial [Cellvibrio mixtus]|uniref:calcium-binding protein n=1 Tax=Cellvibrio mixtus TaxID=39650 RepID=UPI000586FC55
LFAAVAFQYGDGNDSVTLTADAEIVRGGGGNDVINADGGNDVLFGEAGNDSLSGGDGDDLLDGGVGSDTLNGGAGNDVFVFRKGSGNDTVFAYDTSVDRVDIIRFDDVNPADLKLLRRAGDDLFIEYGVSDSIKVQDYFYSNSYKFSKIEFADGTTYTSTQLFAAVGFQYGDGNDSAVLTSEAEMVRGGLGDDTINAAGGNDVLFGEAGNDSLLGGDGNDVLDGGVGNDYLNGGAGNDVFVFRKGSGVDTVFA